MGVYILLFILISIFYLIRNFIPLKFQKLVLFSLFLILSFVAGFRYQVGTDTQMYESIYNRSLNIVYSKDFVEIGYLYLNKLFVKLGLSFQFFLLATAFFINYYFIRGFYKLKLDPIASLFYYVTTGIYFSTFNTLRQAIATAIIFGFFYLLLEKKYIKFVIVILIAFLIHRSVFVIIFMILLYQVTLSPLLFLVCLPVLIIILNMSFLNNIILNLFQFLPAKYTMYMGDIFNQSGVKIINLLLPTLVLIIILIFYKKLILVNKNNRFFINLFFVYYFCVIISIKFFLFYRISDYFSISMLLVLPSIVSLFRVKDRVIIDVFVVITFVLYISGSILSGHYGVYPYQYNFSLNPFAQ